MGKNDEKLSARARPDRDRSPTTPEAETEPSGSSDVAMSAVQTEVPINPGTRIGEYVVESRLGQGSFGDVFRAIQPIIGKEVAIKVLGLRYSQDPGVVSRFISEARAVNKIGHENIVDIFSFGQFTDGRQYYVMPYLDGVTLDVHLADRGPLSPSEALVLLAPIAEALDAAHAAGIAHRDLKPANVFLAKKAQGGWSPKLLDFGVAKLMHDDIPRAHQTGAGMAVGTPHYMSPEQCRGEPDVDHRTDIYAFGVLAFQLLTGRLPFEAASAMEILVKHMMADPPSPTDFRPELPKGVAGMVLWMLEKDRERRPPNLRVAVDALRKASDHELRIPDFENGRDADDGDRERPGRPDRGAATSRPPSMDRSSSAPSNPTTSTGRASSPLSSPSTLLPEASPIDRTADGHGRFIAVGLALILLGSVAGYFGLRALVGDQTVEVDRAGVKSKDTANLEHHGPDDHPPAGSSVAASEAKDTTNTSATSATSATAKSNTEVIDAADAGARAVHDAAVSKSEASMTKDRAQRRQAKKPRDRSDPKGRARDEDSLERWE